MTATAVVLDTNVFVAAAFRPSSDCGRVIEAVRSSDLRLVWNEPTRDETRALMTRIPPISWDSVEPLFEEANRWPEDVDPGRFSFVDDPDDRKFAALAAASGATLLTLDRHLLEAAVDGSFRVSTPSGFLRRRNSATQRERIPE